MPKHIEPVASSETVLLSRFDHVFIGVLLLAGLCWRKAVEIRRPEDQGIKVLWSRRISADNELLPSIYAHLQPGTTTLA
jgi:hypothetical protein